MEIHVTETELGEDTRRGIEARRIERTHGPEYDNDVNPVFLNEGLFRYRLDRFALGRKLRGGMEFWTAKDQGEYNKWRSERAYIGGRLGKDAAMVVLRGAARRGWPGGHVPSWGIGET